ncbi:MAG: hypothetical protein RIQ60_4146 [Pseudomonadota bacterium]|jgi:hypothetical protein
MQRPATLCARHLLRLLILGCGWTQGLQAILAGRRDHFRRLRRAGDGQGSLRVAEAHAAVTAGAAVTAAAPA